MTSRHDAQRALIEQLRAQRSAAARDTATMLQGAYHAREMAELSHDVYAAALGTGTPPPGWTRATADLDQLRKAMPELSLSDAELRELLSPRESGFRAEIYLPDPAVLGPGYKPTVVFKGSTGHVIGDDGIRRPTAAEDFLGNNIPQSMGLQTDYYDRAMSVAVALRRKGIDFDLAGHSLGGGMASAAAAVSGMRAVTWNAAGLHPDTAPQFAQRNGGLPLFDTGRIVSAWQVQGELLNDGVQTELRGMSDRHRERMGSLLTETVELLQGTPHGRRMLEARLIGTLPETAHPAVHALLDRLQQGDAASLIRDLPQAAGERQPPLIAMTRQELHLVERESRVSLGELHLLAGPVLDVAMHGVRGANSGARAGQVVAGHGQALGTGLGAAGERIDSGAIIAGAALQRSHVGVGMAFDQGAQVLGTLTAEARMAGARIESAVAEGRSRTVSGALETQGAGWRWFGDAVGPVSEAWRDVLHARAERADAAAGSVRAQGRADADAALARGREAAEARRDAAQAVGEGLRAGAVATGTRSRDTLVYVGERLDAGFVVVGAQLTRISGYAPVAGAALGGTSGVALGTVSTFASVNPQAPAHWYGAVRLARDGLGGLRESVGRHGMDSAVLPSLERYIDDQEQAARQLLPRPARAGSGSSVREGIPSLLTGDAGIAMSQLLTSARNGDAAAVARASQTLLDTRGAREWLAYGQQQMEADARCTAPETGYPAATIPDAVRAAEQAYVR
ncbi:hypothetical protein [Luteimonas deserti]|uniref:Phospholipase n=1 Tax=Luteimonas deserti TaxID=2752306 RepID=A0A7Z0TWM8_9GAMM|nr:hypothetical protein [Luteimonas deserti]NYZ63529.1 hypothetical protein [Luteimonas deserti]